MPIENFVFDPTRSGKKQITQKHGQALENAAASMQRPQLVTPMSFGASGSDGPKPAGAAPVAAHAAQPDVRAASRATGAGAPPSGNGPSSGGPGGPGNGGPGNPGGPYNHPAPPGAAKTMSAVLGEIVWLMSQSPLHKQFFISDLEWFVMTPALLQQFRTFYDTDKPIGVVLWATVSDEVAARLAEGTTKLRPQDWKSGDQLWVVEVIAPFGGAEEMVKDLKANVFPTRDVRYLAVKDGKKEVRTV